MKEEIKSTIHKILRKLNLNFRYANEKRPFIFKLKEMYGNKELIGVEIGTYQGENAEYILDSLNIKKLYLIDPYSIYDEYKKEYNTWCGKDMEKTKSKAMRLLNVYNDKIVWLIKSSKDAVKEVPNELDFVYIDGNHEASYALEDMKLYYPKLKKGGLLAGHDMHYGGVINALVKFCYENELELNLRFPDWWIVKK